MRFFRIPSFTGIEAHRDDADRGSLRMVEGCLPHGPGGLRSGPVWKKIGDVQIYSSSDSNYVTAADDGQGNSLLFVSRNSNVHDLAVISEENTDISNFGVTYSVAIPEASLYNAGPANLTPIGNKLYAVGDGSHESMFVGKGPDDTFEVFPDENLYSQEWSRFPKCQFFVQGPKKTIFASGNPDKPLTVYISEPAGLTSPYRDTPYSTEDTTYNQGILSTVDILGSNASRITALSTRGDQVVVHTDKGCHLLYAPAPDQANTGYRVEQAPATNFSAAVSSRVVSRASGALTYWVGHDGQVYKDEAASRGSEDLRSRADEDQANWKSKGVWEHEHPTDLSNSFAAYSPQSGDYLFFIESEEFGALKLYSPINFQVEKNNVAWGCVTTSCDGEEQKSCCGPIIYTTTPPPGSYQTLEECALYSSCDICCNAIGIADCCECPYGPWMVDDDCNCYDSGSICGNGYKSKAECEAFLDSVPEGHQCNRYEKIDCGCVKSVGGSFETKALCEAAVELDSNCGSRYSRDGCICIENEEGEFANLYECRREAIAYNKDCADFNIVDCDCVEVSNGSGEFQGLEACRAALNTREDCQGFEKIDCDCVYTGIGGATKADCERAVQSDENCFSYSIDSCSCIEVSDISGAYSTLEDCQAQLDTDCPRYGIDTSGSFCECVENPSGEYRGVDNCNAALISTEACKSYNLSISACSCEEVTGNTGQYASLAECQAQLDIDCPKHTINTSGGSGASGCECVEDASGEYQGIENCYNALAKNPECLSYEISITSCSCLEILGGEGQYASLAECQAQLDIDCPKHTINTSGASGCECVEDASGEYQGLNECMLALESNATCLTYNLNTIACSCEKIVGTGGQYSSLAECQVQLDIDCPRHTINTSGASGCECVEDASGEYQGLNECNAALASDPDCMTYDIIDCSCVDAGTSGTYNGISECIAALDSACPKHAIVDCACVADPSGNYRGLDKCNAALAVDPFCNPVFWDIDESTCTCTSEQRSEQGTGYLSSPDCHAALDALPACENTYNINDCKCEKDPNGRGVFGDFQGCLEALAVRCPGTQTFYIQGCTCQSDYSGNSPFGSLEDCIDAVNTNVTCKGFVLEGCDCKYFEDTTGQTTYLDWYNYQPTSFPSLSNFFHNGKYWKLHSGGPIEVELIPDGTIIVDTLPLPVGRTLPYFYQPLDNSLYVLSGILPPIIEPEKIEAEGTMSLYECEEAKPRSCYNKYQAPCCLGDSLFGFDTYDECLREAKEKEYFYCSENGGSNSYKECDTNHDLSDYISACSDTEGNNTCTSCSDRYWDLVDCDCLSELRSEKGTGYASEAECIAVRDATPSCDTFDISNCMCVKNIDGAGEFPDLISCQAALEVSCPMHSIVGCQCVEDPDGSFQGLVNCLATLSTDIECSPHWLVDCNCTPADPGEGYDSFPDLLACIAALDQTVECNCDNFDRKYNTLVGDGDTFCLDAGSGSGQFTECECIELGHIII